MNSTANPRTRAQRAFLQAIMIGWVLLGIVCAVVAIAATSPGLGVWAGLSIALPVTLLYSLAREGSGNRAAARLESSPQATFLPRNRWPYIVLALVLAELALALILWGAVVLNWDAPLSDKSFGFVLSAGAIVVAALLVRSTRGHLAPGGILLTPEGIGLAAGTDHQSLATWEEIRQIGPALNNLPKRGDALDMHTDRGVVRILTANISVGELEAMVVIRHYLTHPANRAELGTEPSLTRITDLAATARA